MSKKKTDKEIKKEAWVPSVSLGDALTVNDFDLFKGFHRLSVVQSYENVDDTVNDINESISTLNYLKNKLQEGKARHLKEKEN